MPLTICQISLLDSRTCSPSYAERGFLPLLTPSDTFLLLSFPLRVISIVCCCHDQPPFARYQPIAALSPPSTPILCSALSCCSPLLCIHALREPANMLSFCLQSTYEYVTFNTNLSLETVARQLFGPLPTGHPITTSCWISKTT